MYVKFPKFFLLALVVNVCLLTAYEVVYTGDLLAFAMRTNTDYRFTHVPYWSPFLIEMGYGYGNNGFTGDGIAQMPNSIFFILVGMVCFNLIVIGIIEQKSLRQRTFQPYNFGTLSR